MPLNPAARYEFSEKATASYEEIRAAMLAMVDSPVRVSTNTHAEDPAASLHGVVECRGVLGRPGLLGDREDEVLAFPIHGPEGAFVRIGRSAFVEGVVSPGVLGAVFDSVHLRVATEIE